MTMPTYATQDDCEALIEGLVVDDPAGFARLIERAEQDLDALAFTLLPRRDDAPKVDLDDLDAHEQQGLVAATAAQVAYRLEMGPEFFVRAQRESVSSRAVSHKGRLPTLGPQTSRELTAAGLWRLTTSTRRRPGADPDRWNSE